MDSTVLLVVACLGTCFFAFICGYRDGRSL